MQASYVAAALPRRPRSLAGLVGIAVRRPGGRRLVSLASALLMLSAVGLFAYPLFTDIYQRIRQAQLSHQLHGPSYANAYRENRIAVGEGLTRLVIGEIGLDVLVVQGTTPAALSSGAGHYQNTPLPGQPGNVAIAGHRTTFGHPFNHLDEVTPGAQIELITPFDDYYYTSVRTFDGQVNPHAVLPTDTAVLAQPSDRADHWLTLTTCTPKGSAALRLVLRAVLTRTVPITGSS
jgi:sortase A